MKFMEVGIKSVKGIVIGGMILLLLLSILPSNALAISGKPIIIGVTTQISGPCALEGLREKQGTLLAVEEINSKGGVLGRPLEVIILDTRYTIDGAISAANKLITNPEVVAVMAPCLSSACLALEDIFNKAGVAFIAGAQNHNLNKSKLGHPYFFRSRPVDSFYGASLGIFVVKELKAKKVAIFYNNDDFGTGMKNTTKDAVEKLGAEVVILEGHNTGDKDVTGQILKIKKSGAEALIVWTHPAEGVIITRQAKELGLNIPLIGHCSFVEATFISLAGPEYSEGWYGASEVFMSNPDERFQEFKKSFNAKYGEEPEMHAAQNYDEVYLIAEAIKLSGRADREGVVYGLAKIKDFKGAKSTYTFDEEHNGVHEMYIAKNVLKDGEIRAMPITKIYETGWTK